MAEETRRPQLAAESIRALAIETGITEEQISDIVSMVGPNRASILREARLLSQARQFPNWPPR
ncbi:hypothetical protein BPNPMPFG_003322 [Mesorhizobium sp. AR07]|uniref:hypothetical protein n=1 Tax=Mesorhizobium sp. AR07 TaxID=2865838 RepID=UPI00215F6F90|nr:hypothetical protein [Mesorhizobium sp. AR07]UVK46673.1 hypothetical protein BPNPMPFG_002367 [Mesorhizobium sp. AR07]UVK47536.1 hypothetical protein BPNPMPFG_003322 [Mesorhizobium sp. AR07]